MDVRSIKSIRIPEGNVSKITDSKGRVLWSSGSQGGFIPLLESQPLSYAYNRPQYFRNKAREDAWGSPVYFVPSTNIFDEVGQAGPGYEYGKPYNVDQGMYGNCTWWVMGRCHEVSGIILKECVGDASGFYAKYSGKKDGGSLTSGVYFGDTIKAGDIIVFADSTSKLGTGHVIFVEKVDGNTLTVSESGYSHNASYKGMACLVYTLDKTKFKCGASISLRPQSPYSEIIYGVIHTGPEKIEFDYVLSGNYKEVDILYTADSHISWKGSGNGQYDSQSPQMFTWENISNYKDKLENANIPTFCVDCGDWSKGGATDSTSSNLYETSLNKFSTLGTKGYTGYIATTYGNHEWKFGNATTTTDYLRRMNNFTACNFIKNNGNFSSYNKPYRAIKIGDKKIGIIGIGYPSPNGKNDSYDGTNGIWYYDQYLFYDATNDKSKQEQKKAANSSLYKQVQKYIDLMKRNNFDYIIAIAHMDNNRDEDFYDDSRFRARAEYLLMNTSGLDFVIPGHRNYPTDPLFTTDLNGRSCMVMPEAGSGLNSFGRIKLKFDGSGYEYKLLRSISDLDII